MGKSYIKIFIFLFLLLNISSLQYVIVYAIDLESINDSFYFGYDGYFVIDGEVVNNGNYPYEDVKITVTYYNSINNVIGSAETYTVNEILIPQQKSPFLLSSYPLKDLDVDHYQLEVTGIKSSYYPYEDLKTQNVYFDYVDDYYVLYGEVMNYGDYTSTGVEVIVTYYDSEGYVLGSSYAYTNPDEIEPDDTSYFEVSSDPYIIEPDTFLLQIQCNEVWPLSTISCSVSQSQVGLGTTQTVTGTITPVTSDADILVTYTKPNGSKITRTVKSNAQGNYKDTINPDTTGTWKVKASWEGTPTHLDSVSEEVSFTVTSKQSTTISLSLNTTQATTADTIKMSGTITPKVTGKTVTLYFTLPDTTQSTVVVTTDLNGNYIADIYDFNQMGTWTVKAGWDGDTTYTGSTSATRSFVISETSTKIKVYVRDSSSNPISGATITSNTQPTGQVTLSGKTSSDGTFTFTSVKSGSYTFTINKNGYKSKSDSITATLGITTDKIVILEAESGEIPAYPYKSIIIGVIAFLAIYILIDNSRAKSGDHVFK